MARINFLKTQEIPHKRSHRLLWYRKQLLFALWAVQTIATIVWVIKHG